ncbi:light-harvesting protein [Gemmatimonas sp.]|uniref:light-harvesting protein n=1 Tax=Gemmatimonas sp. TaxID=1962908 RepID=UPI0037BEF1CB
MPSATGTASPAVRDGHGNVEEPEVTMAMMDNKGMTEEEAIRFNKYWVAGTGTWVLGAVMAHLLAWSWRPWF